MPPIGETCKNKKKIFIIFKVYFGTFISAEEFSETSFIYSPNTEKDLVNILTFFFPLNVFSSYTKLLPLVMV